MICSHIHATTVTDASLCWGVEVGDFFLCFQDAVEDQKGHGCRYVDSNGARSQQSGM